MLGGPAKAAVHRPLGADSVNFINKNNAAAFKFSVLARLFKEIADAARAYTDEHLYEFRT